MKKSHVVVLLVIVLMLTGHAVFAADPTPRPLPGEPVAADAKPKPGDNGLQYIDIVEGKGNSPKVGQTVAAEYVIFVGDAKIESSRLGQPMEFIVGRDQALKGIDEGVRTMKVGGKRKLIVPPALGYGAEGASKVPPNAVMVIDLSLLAIK